MVHKVGEIWKLSLPIMPPSLLAENFHRNKRTPFFRLL